MTLTCAESQDHLLESFDAELTAGMRRQVDLHLSTCAECSAFAAQLRSVDAQLTAALPPVMPPTSLAGNVRARIQRERRSAFRENLPDLIHLTGCGVVTVVCAAMLPIEASVTLGGGVAATIVSYACLAVVRWSLESIEQPDW